MNATRTIPASAIHQILKELRTAEAEARTLLSLLHDAGAVALPGEIPTKIGRIIGSVGFSADRLTSCAIGDVEVTG